MVSKTTENIVSTLKESWLEEVSTKLEVNWSTKFESTPGIKINTQNEFQRYLISIQNKVDDFYIERIEVLKERSIASIGGSKSFINNIRTLIHK